MARPRLQLPEDQIIAAYQAGVPILRLANQHGVDRDVIRRILDDHQIPRIEHRGAHWAAKRAAKAQEATG